MEWGSSILVLRSSHRILQVSKISGSIGWQDTADGFCTSGFATPGQEDANGDLIEESKNQETSMANKGKMDVLEIDERNNAHEQVEELEDNNRMEKKRNRRRGKARKNRDTLNCHSCEKVEKKGLQYSRKEMEDLRFVGLEEQKAKWVQVYCGFGALVGKEYDGLAKLDRGHQKQNVLSFDFDPRSQFQNSSSLSDNLDITEDGSDEMACSLVEGDCSQDDESDEDYSSMQRPAFLVTGAPDFDSGPPEDGLEYLRRVRWEASKIPKVVTVAKVNKTKEQSFYVPQIPDIVKCPENLLPIKEWEESFLADFSELRQAFAKLDVEDPHVKSSSTSSLPSVHVDNALVQMLEENRDTPEATFADSSCTDDNDSCPSESSFTLNTSDPKPHSTPSPDPTLSSLLRMSPAARVSMLKRRISSIQNLSTLSRNDSLWLFALCAAVDCPLDGDATAAIRSLLRKCASLRAEKTQMDDEVVVLNILVAISGRYFGQLEK